jgi:hypothetical protein
MRAVEAIRGGATRLALPFPILVVAFAQTRGPEVPAGGVAPVTPAPAAAPGGSGWLLLFLLVGLFVLVGAGVKIYDVWRKRGDEAIRVQARIADVLLLDPALVHLPVAATAHPSFPRSSPMILEVTGRVPSHELHDSVMSLVSREAQAAGADVQIQDRLVVDPAVAMRHAA